MQTRARCPDVIDFFWEWQRRQTVARSDGIANYALDRCEEAFQRCDWKEFARWHAIYCRERGGSRKPAFTER